jgi:hypothetical protein
MPSSFSYGKAADFEVHPQLLCVIFTPLRENDATLDSTWDASPGYNFTGHEKHRPLESKHPWPGHSGIGCFGVIYLLGLG